jgi:hypothetical protein
LLACRWVDKNESRAGTRVRCVVGRSFRSHLVGDMKKKDQVAAWLRRRELASDRRAGSFSRSKAAKRQREWIRRNWWRLAVELLVIVSMLSTLVWIPSAVRGLAAGAWLASGGWLLALQVLLGSGTAPQIMGDWGEQFTASELRRLRGPGWRVINHLVLTGRGDIDHVAVGPGGVLVVETKWSGEPWTLDATKDERVRAAVSQVASEAVVIRRMFPNDLPAHRVVAVLVLWGGHRKEDKQICVIDGVTVVRGDALRGVLAEIESEMSVTIAQQDRVWKELDRHVKARDAYELQRDGPVPRTPGEIIRRAAEALFAFWLGLFLQALIFRLGYRVFVMSELVFLLAGFLALRYPRWTAAARAWLISVGALGLLIATVVVVDRI